MVKCKKYVNEVQTMNRLVQEFIQYFKETIHIPVYPKTWKGQDKLPIYLRDRYNVFQVTILNIECLVMIPMPDTEITPAAICKHIVQIKKQWDKEVIYVSRAVSAYNRKRLIEQHVSFVIPWNQMYLLPLGIDLREHFKKVWEARTAWSPATQAVFLSVLLHRSVQEFIPGQLADRLGYSAMSISRAYNDMEILGEVRIQKTGRERILHLNADRQLLWEKARQFLQNPVKKQLWVRFASGSCPGVKSGLSALAEYSALSSPSNPVVALERKEWKQLQHNNRVTVLPVQEPDACLLEIWSYSPRLFAERGVVDRFSLYLSLREPDDERVAAALDEMMEKVVW